MSKQITIQLNPLKFKADDISHMRYAVTVIAGVTCDRSRTWEPRIKNQTEVVTSWVLDTADTWWAHFENNGVMINSRYGSDKLMDAVGEVLLHRLPHQWEPKLQNNN